MFGLGVGEIVIILVVALIFIGPKKLPELARGLGKGMREFQNATRGIQDAIQNPTPANNQTLTESNSEPVSAGENDKLDKLAEGQKES